MISRRCQLILERSKHLHKWFHMNVSELIFHFTEEKMTVLFVYFEWYQNLVYSDVYSSSYLKCVKAGMSGNIIGVNISGYCGSVISCKDDKIIILRFSLIENQITVKLSVVSSKIQIPKNAVLKLFQVCVNHSGSSLCFHLFHPGSS